MGRRGVANPRRERAKRARAARSRAPLRRREPPRAPSFRRRRRDLRRFRRPGRRDPAFQLFASRAALEMLCDGFGRVDPVLLGDRERLVERRRVGRDRALSMTPVRSFPTTSLRTTGRPSRARRGEPVDLLSAPRRCLRTALISPISAPLASRASVVVWRASSADVPGRCGHERAPAAGDRRQHEGRFGRRVGHLEHVPRPVDAALARDGMVPANRTARSVSTGSSVTTTPPSISSPRIDSSATATCAAALPPPGRRFPRTRRGRRLRPRCGGSPSRARRCRGRPFADGRPRSRPRGIRVRRRGPRSTRDDHDLRSHEITRGHHWRSRLVAAHGRAGCDGQQTHRRRRLRIRRSNAAFRAEHRRAVVRNPVKLGGLTISRDVSWCRFSETESVGRADCSPRVDQPRGRKCLGGSRPHSGQMSQWISSIEEFR